jgi:hypothetical protein
MDERPTARPAAASERTTDMADLRQCIGSARFGIEAHDAPIEDFPAQPSQQDGLGRMCKRHWNQYTAGLAREAKARKAALGDPAAEVVPNEAASLQSEPRPKRARRTRATAVAAGQGDAA